MNQQSKLNFILNFVYLLAWLCLIFLAWRFIFPCLLPFLLGYLVAFSLRPLAKFFHTKFLINKKASAVLSLLIFYFSFLSLIWFLTVPLTLKLIAALKFLPNYYSNTLLPAFSSLSKDILAALQRLDPHLIEVLDNLLENFFDNVGAMFSALSSRLLDNISAFVGALPLNISFVVFFFLSSAIILINYETIALFFKRQLAIKQISVIKKLRSFLLHTVIKIIKAYFILSLVTFFELWLAFLLLKIKSPFLLAASIALLDALPIFGSGIVLIPWAVVLFIKKRTALAVALMFVYGIILLVRSLIEPKLITSQTGLHPLVTIMSMYFGAHLLGLGGLFIGPVAALTIKHLNETGAINLYKNP